MSPAPSQRAPRAFTPDEATLHPAAELDDALAEGARDLALAATPRPRPRPGWRWGRLLVASLGGLVVLALTIAVSDYVTALLATGGVLGWVALALAMAAGLALLAIVAREVVGIFRLARLRRIREQAEEPVLSDKAVARVIAAVTRIYAGRPELAPARAEIARHDGEVIDPGDRLAIAEQALMPPLDAEASRLIADATRRVSLITAISPTAIIDVAVVLVTQLTLIRRIAALYGGRPGLIGLLRLSRLVIAHLALTGSIALGDDLIQQIIGHSLAARLSARLGEGVLNGLMTARVGIAALDVCRPLPFRTLKSPRVTDFARLMRAGPAGDKQDGGQS